LQDGKLVAVTIGRDERELPLCLTRFDTLDGRIVSDRHLTNLRPSWRGRPVCEVSSTGDQLVIELGSAVLCTTFEGDVRWLRRHLCLPSAADAAVARQSHCRPLIVGSHAILAPRGVLAVKSVRIDTGQLRWKRVLPTLRRLVGRVGDNLLVQTDGGYQALAAETGEPKWHHPVDDPLAAVSWGGPGGFLFAEKVPVQKPGGLQRIRLTWLDPETGRIRATTTLEEPKDRNPCFGPLIACKGRLWGFVGEGQRKHQRQLFRMSPHGEADPPRRIEERAGQTVMKPE